MLTAPAPALAARYVFDVTVTERSTVATGLKGQTQELVSTMSSPMTFQLTFDNFDPTSLLYGNGLGYQEQRISGPVSTSWTPLTDEVLGASGLNTGQLNTIGAAWMQAGFEGAGAFVGFSSTGHIQGNLPNGSFQWNSYGMNLSWSGHFESDDGFATIDSDRFNQMLLAQPTFTFEEFGISWNLAPQGFVTQKSLAGYKGSATLNRSLSNIPETSAAPEPSAWVVMIAGLGLAGAALRRRRRAAA